MAVEFWGVRPVLHEEKITEVRYRQAKVGAHTEVGRPFEAVPRAFQESLEGSLSLCMVDDDSELWNPLLRKNMEDICIDLNLREFRVVFVHAQAFAGFDDARQIVEVWNAIGIRFLLYWIEVYEKVTRDFGAKHGLCPGLGLLAWLAANDADCLPPGRSTKESIFPFSAFGNAELDIVKHCSRLPIGDIVSKMSWRGFLRRQLQHL